MCQFSVWLGSLTVTCRSCNPKVTQGYRFDSAPGHCQTSCSHTCASVTKQYNLVPAAPLGRKQAHHAIPVSYTHLTLPTNREV